MDIKNLSTLQIHKLSPEQYKREFEANRLDENALYLVEGDNNSTIIDVTELPTENIRDDVLYRLTFGRLVLSQTDIGHVYFVETLPETGIPFVPVDENGEPVEAELVLYYNTTDNTLNMYLDDDLAAMMGTPVGWISCESLGITFGGIITDINDDPSDNAYRVLLSFNVYVYKDGIWLPMKQKTIGMEGTGYLAEIFNSPVNIASGMYSHAEGNETTASGDYSHAEGLRNIASGNESHAEGWITTASGDRSHAEGYSTTASGECSHAEGYETTASGNDSHAEGKETIAAGCSQHVQGEYNIIDPNYDPNNGAKRGKYAHIVGNGTYIKESNAHTLDWEGNAWFQGDVYVGSTSGTNKDTGSKKLATEEFVNSLYGNFLPVDELTDSYAKVRPLLLSADNGEVSLTPSGINVENSDGDVIAINSTGVSATNTESENYAILNTQGVSAYSSTGEVYTSLNGANGLALQGGEDTINLNYNGLTIETDSLDLKLNSGNGLSFTNYDNGKTVIVSPDLMFIDRGTSSTIIDENGFVLLKDNGPSTTLSPTSLSFTIPNPNDAEHPSILGVSGNEGDHSFTLSTSLGDLNLFSNNRISLSATNGIVLSSPTSISTTPTSDNHIVNKKYVDEKIGKPADKVTIYQDDGTGENFTSAIGTLIVENGISADVDSDGNLIYDVVFTEDEGGIPASAIDFTPNSFVNENNVQSAIESL